MIPKRIFFYWSGGNLSWMRYMTLYSFRRYNPDWEVVLYLSDNDNKVKTWNGIEEQDFSNYLGINYLDKLEELNIKIEKVELPDEMKKLDNLSPVHESDLFRYYQLYKNGGIYCDMDVIFFRSIDNFYNNINNIDTILYQSPDYIAIGFLGSSIGNQFYKDIFDFGILNFNMSNYQSLGVDLIYMMYNGNRFTSQILPKIISRYPDLNFYNIPESLVYHFDWTKIEYNFRTAIYVNKFPSDSIGYHWFGGSKISQHHNNIMNENNYRDFNTTFSVIAKEILK